MRVGNRISSGSGTTASPMPKSTCTRILVLPIPCRLRLAEQASLDRCGMIPGHGSLVSRAASSKREGSTRSVSSSSAVVTFRSRMASYNASKTASHPIGRSNRKQSTTVRAGDVMRAGTPSNCVSYTPCVQGHAAEPEQAYMDSGNPRRPRLVRDGQPDLPWDAAPDLVYFERGQQAYDRVRPAGADGGQGVVLRRLGIREAVQPAGYALDHSRRLQAPKPVMGDSLRLDLIRTEVAPQTDLPEVAAARAVVHQASKMSAFQTSMPAFSGGWPRIQSR